MYNELTKTTKSGGLCNGLIFFAPVLQNKPCISAQPPPTTVTFAIAYVYIIMTNNCLEICQFKIEDSSVIAKKLLYMIYILTPHCFRIRNITGAYGLNEYARRRLLGGFSMPKS